MRSSAELFRQKKCRFDTLDGTKILYKKNGERGNENRIDIHSLLFIVFFVKLQYNDTIFFDKNHAKKVTNFDNFFHENSTRKRGV